MRHLLLFSFILLISNMGLSQNVKYLPAPFYAPISFDTKADQDQWSITGGKGKKNTFWMVSGDRPFVLLLDKPNGSSTGESLLFKDYAWVIDENGPWIKIGVGNKPGNKITSLKKSGWVKKTDVLLWPYCLRDKNTGITKKGFLLNKVSEIEKVLRDDDHQLVRIYDGPNSSKVIASRGIYNVYFIFKEENNRVLIGGTDYITSFNMNESILGWVDNIRIEKWNQRLTLECNWEEPSYSIRRNDETKRVYGFSNQIPADNYSKHGVLDKDKILWENDPAKKDFPSPLRSDENEKRAKGTVFRFPVFTKSSGFYQSGSINTIPTQKVLADGNKIPSGEIPQDELDQIKESFNKRVAPKRENINIGFLVEGSAKMEGYKASILAAIASISTYLPDYVNVKYSACVYRDANLVKNKWDLEMTSLTKDKQKVIDFINKTVFNDYTDPDNFTNQRYAMLQFLNKAGFSSNQNNILIVLGAGSDFYHDFGRRETADAAGESKYLMQEEDLQKIYDKLSLYDMSIAYLQVELKGGRAYSKFAEDARGILVNAAQQQYSSYKVIEKMISDAKIKSPEMPDLEEGNTVVLSNGVGYGIIKRPERNSNFKPAEISAFVKESINRSAERVEDLYSLLRKIVESGGVNASKIDDSFSPLVWDFINSLPDHIGKRVLDEKIKLYTSLFLPLSIPGVDEPYKYVIFMPEIELNGYVEQLNDLSRSLNDAASEKRVQLYNASVSLLQKLSGDRLSLKEVDKKGLEELLKLSMGIQLEGIKLDMGGIRIIDIRDKKIVTDEQLQIWTSNLAEKATKLESIRKRGKDYPYAYTVGDAVYFWLDIDLLDWSEMPEK